MTCHYLDLGSASDWLKQIFPRGTTNQKHYPDLDSDTSSVWNFCARFSDVNFKGKPVVAFQNIGCFLRPATCHKKMTQRQKVFIFLRNSPYSAITKDIKAFTRDYSHKICIRVISRMRQHKWRKKCNDPFRNCISGVLNFYDLLCIYFFIPRFKFTKFIYSFFHTWRGIKFMCSTCWG